MNKKRTFQDFSPNAQISSNTLLLNSKKDRSKNVLWTTDIRQELPVFMGLEGPSTSQPRTLIQVFEESVAEMQNMPALHIERAGKWVEATWNEYRDQAVNFAKAAISKGVEAFQTVNILGINSPEWFYSFIGGIYACVVPVGVYLTNNSETCGYIAKHSECGILVCDSVEQFSKYSGQLAELTSIKAVVIWDPALNDEELKKLINPYVPVYSWREFIRIGKKSNVDLEFNRRRQLQTPGTCCNVVYTSGTTGNPKAVLLTHDNLLYPCLAGKDFLPGLEKVKVVSFLPLSHIAAQQVDIIGKNP